MPEIDNTPETIKAIYQHYERKTQSHRPHLGASRIGLPCDRALWYEFRHCQMPKFPGRILRLFETGHREEARVIANLRAIGIEVYDRDPRDPSKQINYHDLDCPHFAGSLDGIGRGFVEAPKAWHVIEIKTMNKKQFDTLESLSSGVKGLKPEHYAQMQIYMHWSKLDRAYYFCVCKDDDRIYGERVHYDKDAALELTERAHRIIYADVPPDKKSTNPDRPPCLWCEYKDLCYGHKCADVNCRTCAHSSPYKTGTWKCAKKAYQTGSIFCRNHIFIPDLVPMECTGADADAGTISYITDYGKEIINGPGNMSSEEIKEMIDNGKR